MEQALERRPAGQQAASTAGVQGAWDDLRRYLESRCKDLCEEVRHYPTPIARCDVQLTKLIEQRTHALESLQRFTATEGERGPGSAPPSLAAMRGFVAGYASSDDDIEAGLVARLHAALKGKAP